MKRFEFQLEQVLRVKRDLLKLAEAELAQARQMLTLAQADLRKCQEMLANVSHAVAGRIGSTMSPAQWSSICEQSEWLGTEIAQKTRRVVELSDAVEIAQQKRNEIASNVEGLETDKGEQLMAWKQELSKHEQSQLDEFSLRQWLNNQRNTQAA